MTGRKSSGQTDKGAPYTGDSGRTARPSTLSASGQKRKLGTSVHKSLFLIAFLVPFFCCIHVTCRVPSVPGICRRMRLIHLPILHLLHYSS